MNETLDRLERLFGSRVLVAAIVLVLLYTVAQALIKLTSLMSERDALQHRLNALKMHYELLKTAYEIQVIRSENRLPEDPQEIRLAEEARRLVEYHSQPDHLTQMKTDFTRELSSLAGRHKLIGYLLYLTAQLGLRLWGTGLVAYSVVAAIFGDESTKEGANWDNILIVSVLIIFGFWLSNLVILSTKAAGIPDKLRYWTYVTGFSIATFLVWLGSVT